MAEGWIIITKTPRVLGELNFPPLTEWFAVAIPDRNAALRVLRLRKNLNGAKILVAGAATREFLDQYDVRLGRVELLWVIQPSKK